MTPKRRHALIIVLALVMTLLPAQAIAGFAQTTDEAQRQANKEVALKFYAAVNGELNDLHDVVASDVIDHSPVPGQPPGPEGIIQAFLVLRGAFPDWQVRWYEIVSEGDLVVARGIGSGVHQGNLYGIPGTGKPVAIDGTNVFRIRDGMIVERWEALDVLGALMQIGFLPPMPGLELASAVKETDLVPIPVGATPAPASSFAGDTEANKELVRRYYDAFNAGDTSALDQLLAADIVNLQPAMGLAAGAEGIKQLVTAYKTGFPDGQISIVDLVAEGDAVAANLAFSGTQQGLFAGIPPTNKRVEGVRMVAVWHVADGKLVQYWPVVDNLGLVTQLGLIPAFSPPAATPGAGAGASPVA